jgi:hypothetical protein
VIQHIRRTAVIVVTLVAASFAVAASPAVAAENPSTCTYSPGASWTYTYDNRTHRALSGTFSIAPWFRCNSGKLGMSVRGVLRRDHSAQLTTSASCRTGSTGLAQCSAVQAPKVKKSYGTSIRGKWDEVLFLTLTGPGVRGYETGDPAHCHYTATNVTTTCTYTVNLATIT